MDLADYTFQPDLALATTIPSRWYTDPAMMPIEVERAFCATWQLVGRLDQVGQPGDFFSCWVGGEPLVITRDTAGELHAFYNVCRHRAGAVAEGCGNRKTLQCMYHAWTYGLDGKLLNTPEFKADANAGYKRIFEGFQKDYGFGKPDFKLMKPKGCDACGGSGYKGRVGLHEMLVGTDPLKKLIQEHARVAEMLAIALEEGMRTLKQDGMEKCLMGVTHMKEVRAVCVK